MYKISELDTYLFNEGLMEEAYKIFGSHIVCEDGVWGVRFTVYAPHARIISVIGDFNNWDSRTCVLEKVDDMGIYSKFVPGIGEWTKYKYMIVTQNGDTIYKADPYGYFSDLRPESCTKVYDIDHYEWHDQEYLNKRKKRNHKEEPIAIYEMNLGSWRKKDNGEFYKYNELVDILIPYLKDMGFNYVEFMPIYEYPLDESWGYQGTGYYSATSRFGVPKDLMYLIDKLHEADIKVIFDWVPGHTCKDPQGLYMFDGAPVYEYADPRIRENEVWGTLNMDLGKGIVRSFFLSNAKFFMEYFHVDGFRLDAVSNIFYYLGDSRNGTNEGGVEFLKRLNGVVKRYDPNVILCAEDSTTFPNVTKDPYFGGVGFDYKWNMGWMNDTLKYFSKDPIYRKYHHDNITFGLVYAFDENFILPLSHDEVVHGKKSLIDKMPGDYWQKFANYRSLLGLMFTHPGKKLLFMGGEFAQFHEWKDKEPLDWFLLTYPMHDSARVYVKDLVHLYKKEKALYQLDFDRQAFKWIDPSNTNQSVFSFVRYSKIENNFVVVLVNLTPNTYSNYKIGVPKVGEYKEIFNSDLAKYGGSNIYNGLNPIATPDTYQGCEASMNINVSPLAIHIFKYKK